MPNAMDSAKAALQRYFGYSAFRPGQIDVVAAVLSGADTLAVLPTGAGKSLCYQVPALVLPGLTVVISPLISLMKDQVDRLETRGVAATFLNSTLNPGDVARRLERATSGELKLLYVAPERFEASDLHRCLSRCTVSLLAVDEAHCISEWGHDFRPSFRRIANVREKFGELQAIALTATATPAVRRDIIRQLALRAPRIIVSGFDRGNLQYAVRACRTDADKDRALLDVVKSHARPAIVYASTRSSVERIARHLTRTGIHALPYHAGLDAAHRQDVQDAFMRAGVGTIVATNAFGMGIDKPDVRLVIHYSMPGTLEAYYQEAGRAGRDGMPGQCVLLHSYRDRFTHEWFIRGMYPDRSAVEREYAALNRSHVSGQVTRESPDVEGRAAVRLLLRESVLVQHRGSDASIRVRLLATPTRIRRELSRETDASELALLRALWRLGGARADQSFLVDLGALVPGVAARDARATLQRLRGRQFVDFAVIGAGLYLRRPNAPLGSFAIDWDGLARRRAADLAKLDMMQGYAHTKNCRRAFVLRYFGERRTSEPCDGCDNCLGR